MTKTIFCAKLQQEAAAMDTPPFPGALGERIHACVSQQGWNMWLSHQTMLINEYRLSMIDPKSREFLRNEMIAYFFGTGSDTPSGFTAIHKA